MAANAGDERAARSRLPNGWGSDEDIWPQNTGCSIRGAWQRLTDRNLSGCRKPLRSVRVCIAASIRGPTHEPGAGPRICVSRSRPFTVRKVRRKTHRAWAFSRLYRSRCRGFRTGASPVGRPCDVNRARLAWHSLYDTRRLLRCRCPQAPGRNEKDLLGIRLLTNKHYDCPYVVVRYRLSWAS